MVVRSMIRSMRFASVWEHHCHVQITTRALQMAVLMEFVDLRHANGTVMGLATYLMAAYRSTKTAAGNCGCNNAEPAVL